MAAHPGRPLSLRRVDAAPAGPVDSRGGGRRLGAGGRDSGRPGGWGQEERDAGVFSGRGTRDCRRRARLYAAARATRSEEHTSELQSLTNLVCRLLLEKKKQK